jgi:hypothetical protein
MRSFDQRNGNEDGVVVRYHTMRSVPNPHPCHLSHRACE